MNKLEIFETVSFHLVKPCNMACKFCYATFNSFKVEKQLSLRDIAIILLKLKEAGVEKVTFAGGEPMLYPNLAAAIITAKEIGLTTSIITNGSMLTENWLRMMTNHLDWIGVSIDSLNPETNEKIGRVTNKQPIDYYQLVELINKYNYKLKINTVVNIHNQEEDFRQFMKFSKVTRWKVFDTLRVEGQNEEQFEAIKSTKYSEFIERNFCKPMIAENNYLMSGSYLLIDPMGRFYENWGSHNKKSDSLITHSVEHCLGQIQLDRERFIDRGGIYEW